MKQTLQISGLTLGKYIYCFVISCWLFSRIFLCLIVADFPESIPAIEDLKFCLERTNQRQQLLASLKSAFETRLLHPGQ